MLLIRAQVADSEVLDSGGSAQFPLSLFPLNYNYAVSHKVFQAPSHRLAG
jgi:hypothetical protein